VSDYLELPDYSGLFLEVDTRERDLARIHHITSWFEGCGGDVKRVTANACDYVVYGKFKGKRMDLGLEFKSIIDLCTSWEELPKRFGNTIEHYTDVALFIAGRIDITLHDDGKYYIINRVAKNGGLEWLPYAYYQARMQEYAECGFHIRQFDNPFLFSISLDNLLGYLVGYPHTMTVRAKDDEYRTNYSMYQQIPGIGAKTSLEMGNHSVSYWLNNNEELLNLVKTSKFEKIMHVWLDK